MSKQQSILMIEPPCYGVESEYIVSKGHECAYCRGAGSFVYDERWGDEVAKVCPMCQGKGKLDAVINITWRPSEE